MRNLYSIVLLLFLAFVFLPLKSQGFTDTLKTDASKYKWEKFSIRLGGFLTTMNSDVRLGSQQLGLGIIINFEDALDLSTSRFVVRSEMEYNFGSRERSYLKLGYFGLFRNASKVLESELEIGNSVFPVGTKLQSRFDIQILRGTYNYSFYKDERINLGLSVGIYVLPIKFSVSSSNQIQENAEFIAPLPLVGISNTIFITSKILFKQNIEVLYIETNKFKGKISDLNLWIEYNPWKHFGFGLGFNGFQFNLTAYKSKGFINDFEGSVRTEFSGLLFYGKYYF